MKKTLILLMLLKFAIFFSQARIGFTYKQIKEEFKDDGIENDKTKAGNPYLALEMKNFFVGYYFDENLVCNTTKILPKNQNALNAMIQRYNDDYVIISDVKWKMYSDKGICYISLVYENDLAFFVWE